MSVPLLEGSSGAAVADSTDYEQFSSPATATSSGRADRRGLLTVHVGDGVTVSQEDLELLLVLVQTVLLLAWVYSEVLN